MSLLTQDQGYGQTSTVEQDSFTRILNCQFYDTEEVRMLRPSIYTNAFEYCGVAIAGSATSSPVWTCLRKTYDSNAKPSRMQIRFNVVWDSVTTGWN